MSPLADSEPLIQLSAVSKSYGRDGVPVPALRGVDMEVQHGEFTAVMGPSGSGNRRSSTSWACSTPITRAATTWTES